MGNLVQPDLRKAVREYTEHYHVERNHQGRGNEVIETPCEEPNMDRAVECQGGSEVSSSTIGGQHDRGPTFGTGRGSLGSKPIWLSW